MKKFLVIILFPLALLCGCKTTEANYRAAYEVARDKNASSGLGADVDAAMAREEMPKEVDFGGVVLPSLTIRLYAVEVAGEETVTPGIYNVALARFAQRFNAQSLCQRLRDNGASGAFVAKDREQNYYVLAGTTGDAAAALSLLESRPEKNTYECKAPFPCVIVSR